MALPILKVLLAAIDVTVLALVVALLLSNRKSQRHDVRSWATAFQVLVLTWLILRGVFWVSTITAGDKWEANVFYLLYWLPNPLQFGSFLILPLFYSQVLSSKREWKARSRVIAPIYMSLVGGMIVFMVVGALLKAIDESKGFECVSSAPSSPHPRQRCYRMEFTNEAFRVITALCFFGLAAVVAAFGVRMSKLTTPQNRLYSIYHPRALTTLNWFLCVVFLSKGAYQMSVILKLWYLPDLPLQGTEDVCFLNFVVFVVWDYVPALWILLTMTTSVSVNRGGYAGSAVVKAGFPPRTSCTGDVRNLPDYGLFREIKAAAFAAEEVARLEAQSRFGSRSFDTALQYSPSPRSSSSPMANSWFREGDNNPEGTKISPFGSSLGSSFGSASMHSITVCPGSLASSTESSLGGVGFAASPNAVPDSAPHVTGVWSRASSSQQQQQSASAETEGVGRVCGGGGGGGGSSGGRFQSVQQQQQQQQKHREQFERDELQHRHDSYHTWLQQQQYQQYRHHHQPRHQQSSYLAVGGAKYAKNGSGGGEIGSRIEAVGEGGGLFGGGGSNGRGGGRSGVDGVGRAAEVVGWWTKLVGGWGEKKKKTRGPKIPVKHVGATGEGASNGGSSSSNEASRLLGNAVDSSSSTWGSMEFSLEIGGHSLHERGAVDASNASGGPLPSVEEQADAVDRSRQHDGRTTVGSQGNPTEKPSTSLSSGVVPPQQQQQQKMLQRKPGGSGHGYVTVAHTIAPSSKTAAGSNSGNGDSSSGLVMERVTFHPEVFSQGGLR